MRSPRASVLLFTLLLAGCSQKTSGEGALFDMAVSEKITAKGLGARVEVVRDTYGIPHIYGKTEGDVAFAQGYIHASDRLFQMILQRGAARGELAILFGGGMVADDIQTRMFEFYRVGKDVYDKGDLTSEERTFLDKYAAGVTAYLKSMNPEDMPLEFLAQGIKDPGLITGKLLGGGWFPYDSLAFARLMTFMLSFDNEGSEGTKYETILKSISQKLVELKLEPDTAAAEKTALGYLQDIYATSPLRRAIVAEPGSYDKFEKSPPRGGHRTEARKGIERPATDPLAGVSFDGLDDYVRRLQSITGLSPTSNNWVVSGQKSATGYPILANDPHLSLQQPSVFHEAHLNTQLLGGSGGMNVAGVMFPMAPGIAIGFNQNIAWGETVVGYDVTDFYVETLVKADGTPDTWTVKNQGNEHPLAPLSTNVIFKAGSSADGECALPKSVAARLDDMLVTRKPPTLDATLDQCHMVATYYEVGGHGPVVRVVRDANGKATSLVTVRWTGFEPTFELRAFKGYLTAKGIDDFQAAVKHFKVGAQNQVVIDSQNIGWFPNALVPKRDTTTCKTPLFLPQSGDGSCDWQGFIDEEKLPKLRNPEKGFIATANNQPTATDEYYHGSFYDVGYRGARITKRLEQALATTGGISIDEMTKIQGDTYLLLCEDFLKVLTGAVSGKEAKAGDAGIPAFSYVNGWDCSSPSGYSYTPETGVLEQSNDATVLSRSVAASIFHAWISNFAHLTFDDQLGGQSLGSQQYARALYQITFRKKCGSSNLAAGEPCRTTGDDAAGSSVFWDDWSTPEVETRDAIALRAYIEAIQGLAAKFGTTKVSQWLWGKLHTLTVRHLGDSADVEGDSAEMFSLPSPLDPLIANLGLKGFPRPGGQFVVDASDPGLDLMTAKQQSSFAYGSGPSYRMVVEMTPNGPNAQTALPGGNVAHPRSRFYGNQLRQFWWANEYKKFPFTQEEVRAAAAELLVFEPSGGK